MVKQYMAVWAAWGGALIAFVTCGCAYARAPETNTMASPPAERFNPAGPGPHPAVVMLYGLGGWHRSYRDEAQALAEAGYVTLLLDYYTAPGALQGARPDRWARWEATVAAALDTLQADPTVDDSRLALLGYSQGAALAMLVAAREERVRAVVNYFGPNPRSWYVRKWFGQAQAEDPTFWQGLPPVLLLHGELDVVVPVVQARQVQAQLTSAQVPHESHIYQHGWHSLNNPPVKTPGQRAIAADAQRRVIDFLDRYLQ